MQLPNFAELPIGRFNSWPYMAGWTGLTDDQKLEIKEWAGDKLSGLFEFGEYPWMVHWPEQNHHEKKEWSRFVIRFMEFSDFLLFKLRFSDFESPSRY